ncbi:hypothetical protein RR48_15032 [Papilio machaon]|uniref:Uncharacterized protein n=1 Tax=Papilio machaon TaxID=76193 RepID=A0A194R0R9_PAPMA|nr:hypothetical protein RR48_15032 [Papilio machaon]
MKRYQRPATQPKYRAFSGPRRTRHRAAPPGPPRVPALPTLPPPEIICLPNIPPQYDVTTLTKPPSTVVS